MAKVWKPVRVRRGVGSVVPVVLAALAATLVGAPAAAAAVPAADQLAPPPPAAHKGAVDLSSSALRAAVEAPGALPSGLAEAGPGQIVVEVLFRPGGAAAARDAVAAAGGDPGITVPGELVQAEVPLGGLEQLEADPAVQFVRPPLEYNAPVEGAERPQLLPEQRVGAYAGEQIQKTNAGAWHAAGITGQGVKVGIIDSFSASHYNAAVSGGEIPQVSGTFCRVNGTNCNASIFSGDRHGIGVAEAVIDMAPSAQIYFASTITAGDTQAALNYFDSQGVDVVTRSQTGRYDGPGNGTGPIASVIQSSAVGQGMFYLNSAGNSAGRFGARGSYWRGSWVDANGNNFIDFAPGDELMGFDCSFLNGLRWNDFGEGAGTTDYDFYLYNSTPAVIAESEDSQGSSGGTALPIERIDSYSCPAGGVAFMAIFRFNAGSGSAGDVLEIMTNGAEVEYPQNPFSASGPMADLNSPGAVAVGAVDPALGTTIANYSSEGPTNDNRIKPDLSAAACVKSLSYAPGCFNGTSSSTPVTAGAAALVLSAGAANSPSSLKSYLLNATVDRGAPGSDNIYGRGELRLPNPPQTGDNQPPNVKALKSKGKSGKKAKLRYRVSDNSGESRERIQVVKRGNVIADITTQFGPATGETYYVVWKVPKRVKGKMRFCAVSQDRAGNNSSSSCADLKIKKKKKKRHRR
jgi:hypothetical protein